MKSFILVFFSKKSILILALLGSLSILYYLLAIKESQGDALVSHKSGIYEEAFNLKIANAGTMKVWYTIDGSIPDNGSSLIYIKDEGILIDKTIEIPTNLASIPTTPAKYPEYSYHWKKPGEVNNSVMIRFKYADEEEIHSYTYLIREKHDNEIPILSLYLNDEAQLFDSISGIYIPGIRFDSLNAERTGNYFERGRDWEREIQFDFISPEYGTFSSNAGLRTHGLRVPLAPQKSLRLYARSEYANKHFQFPFFGEESLPKYKRLLIRSQYSAWGRKLITNAFISHASEGLDVEIFACQSIVMFINGEFWGLAQLVEKDDHHYFKGHFGLEEENLVLAKVSGEPLSDIDGGLTEEVKKLKEIDLSDDKNFKVVSELLDIHSFIDYMIIETFFMNRDWPQNNTQLWKALPDGQWRSSIVDMDGSMLTIAEKGIWDKSISVMTNHGKDVSMYSQLFRSLLQNASFRKQFRDRYYEIIETQFAERRLMPIYDQLVSEYIPYLAQNMERWHNPQSWEEFDKINKRMRDFIRYRPERAKKELDIFLKRYKSEISN